MKDIRGRQIVFLAHCLLNRNAKVAVLAGYRGVHEPLVRLLVKSGAGLVQMPCPEAACFGLLRPLGTDTVEQYDTAEYRSLCRGMAKKMVGEAQSF